MSGCKTRLSIVLTVCVFLGGCYQKTPETSGRTIAQGSADGSAAIDPTTGQSSSSSIQSDGIVVPQQGEAEVRDRILAWKDISTSPLSTVSIDVDTASYARARSQIRSSGQVNADEIRPEDFLNYFPYSYQAPVDDKMIRIHQELVASPWTPGSQILAIGLKAKDLGLIDPPKNLVFLVDVSGSMASEDKLPLVKASLIKLTDSLRAEDKIALVTYAGYTEVALASISGAEKDKIKLAINSLGAGGGTNGSSGINQAYDIAQSQFQAQAVNRVILTTDGDFNVGITDSTALVNLIRQKAEAGIFLTILGFGSSSNDQLMSSVARDGNGNYFFIDTTKEIDKVFGTDLKSNIVTIAKDVKIQIEFNPRLVKSYRIIGYADRILKDDDFNKDARDAGDLGSGQTVTYLFEITPRSALEVFAGTYQPAAGVDPLLYQSQGALTAEAARDEIGTFKLRYKTPEAALSQKLDEPLQSLVAPSASVDVQWQIAVAEAAVLLGKVSGLDSSLTAVRAKAAEAVGVDSLGLRREFIALIDRMISFQGTKP